MFNYLTILFAVITALYFYATRTFNYWKKKGVKYEEPIPLFGNNLPVILAKQNMTEFATKMYWKYPEEKVVGHFYFSNPALLVRDPDLLTLVFTTQFKSFHARGFLDGQEKYKLETLMKHLFIADGDLWRLLKKTLSPSFTSSKLKAMFPIIVARTHQLRERLVTLASDDAGALPVDAFELMIRYNLDFISAYALGIDSDSQKNEHSAIRLLANDIFRTGIKDTIVNLLKWFFPVTFKNVKYLEKVEKNFCDLLNSILRQRSNEHSDRNDFIDLMLKTKAKGRMECESQSPDGTLKKVSMDFDDDLIAAQVFMFFIAGFDTNAAATSYTLHEIAYSPEEQKKIQDDIDRVLAKYNNELSYDAINEMNYLEWAFKEGMRIFPPGGYLLRVCQQNYQLDNGLTVEEGTRIVIPVAGLHQDPKYWDNPEEFRPERFSPKINEPKHKYAYLPFGAGPRSCIGERMGMMQSMAGLAAILSRFSVSPAPTSVRRPPLHPKANLVQLVARGLPLIFTPRF